MTPDPTLAEAPPETRSTAGMTTKVVKGSLWTIAGQFVPMAVSFFTTPLIIRKLGAESYGVLVLVWSIPTYLGFADLGMSTASTRFAAEAYGSNDSDSESRSIWTAAAISLVASLPWAIALIVYSDFILKFLNVPDVIREDAGLAVKYTAVLMVVTFLNSIFNTPQLVRLRMDVNTAINSGFRILGLLTSALAIYWYGAIALAVLSLLGATLAQLVVQVVAGRLLFIELMPVRFSRASIGPLVKYGAALAVAAIAGLAIMNIDKVVLARVASVEMVAYYSVAFTFATLSMLASSAAAQSLIPAFSQLQSPDKLNELSSLFERAVRINIFGLLPLIVGLFVIGKPLMALWAGPSFAENGSVPLRVLLVGVFFSLISIIPYSLLLASGRSHTIALLFWLELFPFLALLIVLAASYGITGAAVAWSIRSVGDAVLMWGVARKYNSVSLIFVKDNLNKVTIALSLLLWPILATIYFSDNVILTFMVFTVSASVYGVFLWNYILSENERTFVKSTLSFSLNEN